MTFKKHRENTGFVGYQYNNSYKPYHKRIKYTQEDLYYNQIKLQKEQYLKLSNNFKRFTFIKNNVNFKNLTKTIIPAFNNTLYIKTNVNKLPKNNFYLILQKENSLKLNKITNIKNVVFDVGTYYKYDIKEINIYTSSKFYIIRYIVLNQIHIKQLSKTLQNLKRHYSYKIKNCYIDPFYEEILYFKSNWMFLNDLAYKT